MGDDSLPFGPIVEALRVLGRGVDADRIAGRRRTKLSRSPRGWCRKPSGVAGEASTSSGEPEWLQIRIFEGVLRLLGRLGEMTPVMLVLEDLHGADRSTRDLLAFLTRNVRGERLFIVATFRVVERMHRRHPLTAWLAEAERQPRVERVDLSSMVRAL